MTKHSDGNMRSQDVELQSTYKKVSDEQPAKHIDEAILKLATEAITSYQSAQRSNRKISGGSWWRELLSSVAFKSAASVALIAIVIVPLLPLGQAPSTSSAPEEFASAPAEVVEKQSVENNIGAQKSIENAGKSRESVVKSEQVAQKQVLMAQPSEANIVASPAVHSQQGSSAPEPIPESLAAEYFVAEPSQAKSDDQSASRALAAQQRTAKQQVDQQTSQKPGFASPLASRSQVEEQKQVEEDLELAEAMEASEKAVVSGSRIKAAESTSDERRSSPSPPVTAFVTELPKALLLELEPRLWESRLLTLLEKEQLDRLQLELDWFVKAYPKYPLKPKLQERHRRR